MDSQSPKGPVRTPARREEAGRKGAQFMIGGSPDRIRPALRTESERQAWRGVGEAWTSLSTLLSGIAVWGGAGWLVDRFAGTHPIFFVAGVLLGNFAGVYLIYVKASREVENDPLVRGVKRRAS